MKAKVLGFIIVAMMVVAGMLCGCAGNAAKPSLEAKVAHDDFFGGIYIDTPVEELDKAGFALGDSVDVIFSNGCSLEDIPYYNGYYVAPDEPLVVAYPGDDRAKVCYNYGECMWDVFELEGTEGVRITVREAGKYKDTQDALSIKYTDEKVDYPDDAVFANYREMKGGSLKAATLFRGASSVDDEHKRVGYVNSFIEKDGIKYDLDLSDSADEVAEMLDEDREEGVDVSYIEGLWNAGNVGCLDLGAAYKSDEFKKTLAQGIYEMCTHEGPYYIHCVEGKDRTGFTCALLEGLAGATYDEIVDDYMITYANYYGITKEEDEAKYTAIKELQIDNMLAYLTDDVSKTGLVTADYKTAARIYLTGGGLTEAQVDEIESAICG